MQPWTKASVTNNSVMYQSAQAGDTVTCVNPSSRNTCLVVGASSSYVGMLIGLGAVSPYCRVSHFGSDNDNSSLAWSDVSWTGYNSSSPHSADEGLNLVIRTPTLSRGGSVTFGWAYSFNARGYLLPSTLSSMWIQEPADTVTGSSCVFSAVANANSLSVSFVLVYQTSVYVSVGVATAPSTVFGDGSALALFAVTFNSTGLTPGDGYVVSDGMCVCMMCMMCV